MMPNAEELFDAAGDTFNPWPGSTRNVLRRSEGIKRGGVQSVEVSRLSRGRNILERVDKDCDRQDSRVNDPDTAGCEPGVNVDLFPATSMYVTATVVTPNTKHWDRGLERYVTGDVTTRVFLQVAGHHPDLNRNEVDDTIDILNDRSTDRNQDGVPDEVQ